MGEFGSAMTVVSCSLKGEFTKESCAGLVGKIIKGIGMTPAHQPIWYGYPVDGKGGVGFSMCQPITESMIVVDAWLGLQGAYLLVASCKAFKVADLIRVVEEEGFKINGINLGDLSLE
jgi:hypothetical protein